MKTRFTGQAERAFDGRVQDRLDGLLAQYYLNRSNFAAARQIFEPNSHVGLFQDGQAIWGEFAASFVEGYASGFYAGLADDPFLAWKLTATLVKLGWRAVASKLSSIRGPDFAVLNIQIVAGTTRFLARGDDMEHALQGVTAGTGAEGSFAVGWLIQRATPTYQEIQSWGQGLTFAADMFVGIGGGIIVSPSQPSVLGVAVGVGVGGKGMSGSFNYKAW